MANAKGLILTQIEPTGLPPVNWRDSYFYCQNSVNTYLHTCVNDWVSSNSISSTKLFCFSRKRRPYKASINKCTLKPWSKSTLKLCHPWVTSSQLFDLTETLTQNDISTAQFVFSLPSDDFIWFSSKALRCFKINWTSQKKTSWVLCLPFFIVQSAFILRRTYWWCY